MRYYPICLDLQNRPVLVVGGGMIAEGKVLQLVEAQANVHIVSPTLTEALRQKVAQGIITYRSGEFAETDLDDKALVISATNIKPKLKKHLIYSIRILNLPVIYAI